MCTRSETGGRCCICAGRRYWWTEPSMAILDWHR